MTELEDEKPQKIPKNLRVSTNKNDSEAFARLIASDKFQKELAEKFQIKAETPKERERSRALIVVQTLSDSFLKLTLDQIEQLAEAYATLGEYKIAKELTLNSDRKAEYFKLWDAVFLPDNQWCQHPERHKFIKDYIFSVKENREMPLLACNVCGIWNVLDAPETLEDARRKRAGIVGNAPRKFNSIADAKRWHQQNVK